MNIYIHANCQGGALAKLMAEVAPREVSIRYREVFSINVEEEFNAFDDDVKGADVIICQPVADNYRGVEWLSSNWIRNNKAPHALMILFPVIYHRGQLPQSYPLRDFHEGRLAYHDAHALDYFVNGKGVDAFLADTARSDFFTPDFVRSEAFLTTSELLRREFSTGCDVPASDIVQEQLSASQPLYCVNHPSRFVLATIGNRMLKQIDVNWRIALEGQETLDHTVVAPYLTTALALDHSGQGIRMDEARTGTVWESREHYFAEVFYAYRNIGAERLAQAMREQGEIVPYLNRFQASHGAARGEDRSKLVKALYTNILGRTSNMREVLHHLRSLDRHGYHRLVNSVLTSEEFRQLGGGRALDARLGNEIV